MAVLMSRYDRSFSTRERGKRLAEEVLIFEREPNVVVDLSDVTTAPSFLQGLLPRLLEDAEHVTLTGVDESLYSMVERITRKLFPGQVTVKQAGVPA